MTNGEKSHTQELSQAIDAAHEVYTPGEPESETRLYRAFLAQARNVVGYKHLAWSAQTLANDIASRAMLALPKFRGGSKVSTWFYRIARNEVNRALRTIIRDSKQLVSIDPRDPEGDEPSEHEPEDKPNDQEAAIDFEKLQQRLPPKQAEVLAFQFEGYTLEEIAKKTGVPLGTIRSRNRLAKAKARRRPKKNKGR
jgi:RNA polymerase sigma-70 factor (ECF subfamily)